MNRRNFLHKSSVAAASIFIFPKAIRKAENKTSHYINSAKVYIDEHTLADYRLTIYDSAVQDFKTATDKEKEILFLVTLTDAENNTVSKGITLFTYTITDAKFIRTEHLFGDVKVYEVTGRLDATKGEFKLPDEMAKTIKFTIKPQVSLTIPNKKEIYLSFQTDNSDDDDCFLTSACVHSKGLPDDCEELSSLRSLRDDYMMHYDEGRRLIEAYYSDGPTVVKAINSCSNKDIIYNYIYDHMVKPTVNLTRQKKYPEAVSYYKNFVSALKKQYC